MAFRLSPVPSRVQRCPQTSCRLTPLPTLETSLTHGNYLRLPPSSHLGSRCLVVQGCPHMTLQGWYRHHRQHRPTRLQLTHQGAHRPAQQAPHCSHLLQTKHRFTLHPDALTLPAPLLQGWGVLLNGLCLVRCCLSPHENPLPIAPTPRRRHRLRLHYSPREDRSTSVSPTRCPWPKPLGPRRSHLALQASAGLCQPGMYWDLPVSAKRYPA
jgi:hypothetical protein